MRAPRLVALACIAGLLALSACDTTTAPTERAPNSFNATVQGAVDATLSGPATFDGTAPPDSGQFVTLPDKFPVGMFVGLVQPEGEADTTRRAIFLAYSGDGVPAPGTYEVGRVRFEDDSLRVPDFWATYVHRDADSLVTTRAEAGTIEVLESSNDALRAELRFETERGLFLPVRDRDETDRAARKFFDVRPFTVTVEGGFHAVRRDMPNRPGAETAVEAGSGPLLGR
jgi:hypothetical protein